MTNRLEIKWKLDGFVDEQRYYCSETAFTVETKPASKAILAGDVRSYVDTNITEGLTYYVCVSSVRNNVEKLSEIMSIKASDNVISLLNFQNSIIDAKSKIWTPAVTPVFSSNRFNLTGNYIKTPYSTDFDWVNSEFTIEAFVNADSWSDWSVAGSISGISKFISHCNTDNDQMNWSFGPIASGKARVYYWDGAQRVLITSTNSIQLNKDVHISFSIDASKAYISVDGIVDVVNRPASIIMPHIIPNIVIGNYYYSGVSGFCGGVRFTKGVARYKSDFIPPDAPFLNY